MDLLNDWISLYAELPETAQIPAGFAARKVAHDIQLTKDGQLVGVEDIGTPQLVPDLGRTSGKVAYLVVDKPDYVFGTSWVNPGKPPHATSVEHCLYLERLNAHAAVPGVAAVLSFIERYATDETLRESVSLRLRHFVRKDNEQGVLTFSVEGQRVHESAEFRQAWPPPDSDARTGTCMYCQRERRLCRIQPGSLAPVFHGKSNVKLMSINNGAQGRNGRQSPLDVHVPLCSECASAAIGYLNYLMTTREHYWNQTQVRGGKPAVYARNVWWLSGRQPDPDTAATLRELLSELLPDMKNEPLPASVPHSPESAVDPHQVRETFSAAQRGQTAPTASLPLFRMATIEQTAARLRITGLREQLVDDVTSHIHRWQELTRISDQRQVSLPRLTTAFGRLEVNSQSQFVPREHSRPVVGGEVLFDAALFGSTLPQHLLRPLIANALADLPQALNARRGEHRHITSPVAPQRAAMLQYFLATAPHLTLNNRSLHMLNEANTSPAYLWGRLLALYTDTKSAFDRARGNAPDTSAIDSQLTRAVTSPLGVFPALDMRNQRDLRRLRNTGNRGIGIAVRCQQAVDTVASQLSAADLPARATVHQQAETLLGYHHQLHHLRQQMLERKAQKDLADAPSKTATTSGDTAATKGETA